MKKSIHLVTLGILFCLCCEASMANPGNLLRIICNPTPAKHDQFGDSVAVVGKNVVIGAWRDDTIAENAGAAYLFDGETGKLLRVFHNPRAAAGDGFGQCIETYGEDVWGECVDFGGR